METKSTRNSFLQWACFASLPWLRRPKQTFSRSKRGSLARKKASHVWGWADKGCWLNFGTYLKENEKDFLLLEEFSFKAKTKPDTEMHLKLFFDSILTFVVGNHRLIVELFVRQATTAATSVTTTTSTTSVNAIRVTGEECRVYGPEHKKYNSDDNSNNNNNIENNPSIPKNRLRCRIITSKAASA